jgi:hypothetical protein
MGVRKLHPGARVGFTCSDLLKQVDAFFVGMISNLSLFIRCLDGIQIQLNR